MSSSPFTCFSCCFSSHSDKYKADDHLGEKGKEATPVVKTASPTHINEIDAIEAGRSNANPHEHKPPSIILTTRLDDFKTQLSSLSPQLSSLSAQLQTQEIWSKKLEGDGIISPEWLFSGLSHITSIGAGGFGAVFHAKVRIQLLPVATLPLSITLTKPFLNHLPPVVPRRDRCQDSRLPGWIKG